MLELEAANETFKINWVPGPNVKTMKKVFPILPYLDDDDIIIYMDDDILLPSGFIQSRLSDFSRNGMAHPISGGASNVGSGYIPNRLSDEKFSCASQPGSLLTKKMLSGYEIFSTNKDVYERSADDSLYTILCKLNGYSYVPCSNYCTSGTGSRNSLTSRFNETSPLRQQGVFKKNGYSP